MQLVWGSRSENNHWSIHSSFTCLWTGSLKHNYLLWPGRKHNCETWWCEDVVAGAMAAIMWQWGLSQRNSWEASLAPPAWHCYIAVSRTGNLWAWCHAEWMITPIINHFYLVVLLSSIWLHLKWHIPLLACKYNGTSYFIDFFVYLYISIIKTRGWAELHQ